jgi:hypothetical protein
VDPAISNRPEVVMGNQVASRTPLMDRQDGAARRRFERRVPFERSDYELVACARPPRWDESGFPVAPKRASLPARVWRLLER